jgi:hypothetical protein
MSDFEVQEISEGGARIAATLKPAVGSKIAVTFPGHKCDCCHSRA